LIVSLLETLESGVPYGASNLNTTGNFNGLNPRPYVTGETVASARDFVLTHEPDPRPQWNPALYRFTPADQFDVHGTYVSERTTRDGIGAPLVAVGREANQDARANFSLPRTYYGVTAIARFEEWMARPESPVPPREPTQDSADRFHYRKEGPTVSGSSPRSPDLSRSPERPPGR
jgi:hypothetical protein